MIQHTAATARPPIQSIATNPFRASNNQQGGSALSSTRPDKVVKPVGSEDPDTTYSTSANMGPRAGRGAEKSTKAAKALASANALLRSQLGSRVRVMA